MTDTSRDNTTDDDAPLPPQTGLQMAPGTGKTRKAIKIVVNAVRANQNFRGVIVVPNHGLADECRARVEHECAAAGVAVTVEVYRGTSQPDPGAPGETMCRRSDEVREVIAAGGSISDACGRRATGLCPHRGGCGYQRQLGARAQIWIVPASMLKKAIPKALKRSSGGVAFDLVIIDEAPWLDLLAGFGPAPAAALLEDMAPAHWTGIPEKDPLDPQGRSDKIVQRVLGIIRQGASNTGAGDVLDVTALRAAGLTKADCGDARARVWKMKEDLGAGERHALARASTADEVKTKLSRIAEKNRRVRMVARLLNIVELRLGGETGPAALRRIDKTTDAGKVGAIAMKWREDIHGEWTESPVIVLDATLSESIVRAWLPRLQVQPAQRLAAPNMRVVQVENSQLGYWTIIPDKTVSKDDKDRARKNAGRVLTMANNLAQAYAGKGTGAFDVLLVMPAALEAEIEALLPSRVGTAHFGALRGLDAFGGVGALVVVSRPSPPVTAVEDMAEVIFGCEIVRTPGRFPEPTKVRTMADGTGRTARDYEHPDPRVEAVRKAITTDELVQAVGRARPSRRTAENPVDVFVLTSAVIPDLPVNECVKLVDIWRDWADENLAQVLINRGVVPKSWEDRAAVVGGRFATCANPADAFQTAFRRTPGAEDQLARAMGDYPQPPLCEFPSNPYRYMSIGKRRKLDAKIIKNNPKAAVDIPSNPGQPAPWPTFRYRRGGRRQGSLVRVRPDIADPRAEVERYLGQ
ncbi:MAG: DEAD/DEAH box helicase family protein, partial [Rhodospirillaceae bacterium]